MAGRFAPLLARLHHRAGAMFVHAELIDENASETFTADLEELVKKGDFSASFIVQAAVGTV